MPRARSRSSARPPSRCSRALARTVLAPSGVSLEPSLQDRQLERGRHEPLLRAVVQVALDPSPRLVGRRHESRARRRQLLSGLGVLDRERHELGERGNSILGARRHRRARRPARRQGTPQMAAENDRARSCRADPEATHQRGHGAADLIEVVDPHRRRGAQHLAQNPAPVDDRGVSDRHGRRRSARPPGHDRRPLWALDA
jgi:hypothetical protein